LLKKGGRCVKGGNLHQKIEWVECKKYTVIDGTTASTWALKMDNLYMTFMNNIIPIKNSEVKCGLT